MSEYFKDHDGTVHLKAAAGSEYTFCSLAFDGEDESVPDMTEHSGPCTCVRCWHDAVEARRAIKGALFKDVVDVTAPHSISWGNET